MSDMIKNWRTSEASKYKFSDAFNVLLDNCYVAWEAVEKSDGKTTVYIFADSGDIDQRFIYVKWSYDESGLIESNSIEIQDKKELKKWLRDSRDSGMIDRDCLINIVRFLYFGE